MPDDFVRYEEKIHLVRTFFAKVLPDYVYINKQILYEMSLVYLQTSKLVFPTAGANGVLASLYVYLSSFPDDQAFVSIRRLVFEGPNFSVWHEKRKDGVELIIPQLLLSNHPGIHTIEILIA